MRSVKQGLLATAAAVALTIGLSGAANALLLQSGDGNESYKIGPNGINATYTAGSTGAAAVLSNTLPSAWFDYNTQGTLADWISFDAGTGNGTLIAPNISNNGGGLGAGTGGTLPLRVALGANANYTALFSENIVIGAGQSATLSAQVWADDTAAVYLLAPDATRTLLFGPNQAQVDPCSGSPIGCAPGDDGMVNAVLNQVGTYTFEVYAFQTNFDGFGVRYDGNVNIVPIPAALPLMLTALGGLGLIARRRKSEVA